MKRESEEHVEQVRPANGPDQRPHPISSLADVSTFCLDLDYRYLIFNRAHADEMKRVYGSEIENGGNMLDFISVVEDRERLKDSLDRASSGDRLSLFLFVGTGDGRRFLEIVCDPLVDERGEMEEIAVMTLDITGRRKLEDENAALLEKLRELMSEIKTLRGFLTICSCCKKVKNEAGKWQQIELYLEKKTDLTFSHGYCPACFEEARRSFRKDR